MAPRFERAWRNRRKAATDRPTAITLADPASWKTIALANAANLAQEPIHETFKPSAFHAAIFRMWTLVIIVLTNGLGPSSGSSSTVSTLSFTTEAQCSTAAAQISGSGYVAPDKGGPYQIIAKCVLRRLNG